MSHWQLVWRLFLCALLLGLTPVHAQVVRQVTHFSGFSPELPDMTPDGSRIVFITGQGLYRVQADGSDLFQITSSPSAVTDPSVSADGNTVVFTLWPTSSCSQVLRVLADGSSMIQLTTCNFDADNPAIAPDGSFAVITWTGNPTGGNPDLSFELFWARTAGIGKRQLTSDNDSHYKNPRLTEDGAWVVFQSQTNVTGGNLDGSFEVFRVTIDGTGLEQMTADPVYGSQEPDVSGSGDRIVYVSQADPLGTNPDHNYEVFLYEPTTGTRGQLTFTSGGNCHQPTITKDGAYVFFGSDVPFFEAAVNPPVEPYRMSVATGVVERMGALRHGGADFQTGDFRYPNRIVPDRTGSRAVFAARGDWIDENPDLNGEIYLVDYTARAMIRVGRESPTLVSWDPEPKPLRYDVIRGDVANVRPGPGGTVDLGPVVCLEDDSPNTSTQGFEDPVQPESGHAFFFVYRGSQGLNDGPGSWGQGTGSAERVVGAGGCTP